MAKIEVNLSGIENAEAKMRSVRVNTVSDISNRIEKTRSSIDGNVLQRNNINNRIINVEKRISAVEKTFVNVERILSNSCNQYTNAETQVINKAAELEMSNPGKSVSSSVLSSFK